MIDPADRVRDQNLREGQYRHITERAWSSCDVGTRLRDWTVLRESVHEQWVPGEVSLEWVLRGRYTGRRRWLRGSERSAIAHGFGDSFIDVPQWEHRAAYGDYSAAEQGREPAPRDGCWQLPSPKFLAELPRQPDLLLQRLRTESPSRTSAWRRRLLRLSYVGPWVYGLDVLSSGLVPADLRAGLYRALVLLPNVRIIDEAVTLSGAAAIALMLDLAPVRHEVFIDPADGHYVGARETVVSWNPTFRVRPGTIVSDSAVSTEVVDASVLPVVAA